MYVCIKCRKEVKLEEYEKRKMCPYCGHRILRKKRPEVPKKVSTD